MLIISDFLDHIIFILLLLHNRIILTTENSPSKKFFTKRNATIALLIAGMVISSVGLYYALKNQNLSGSKIYFPDNACFYQLYNSYTFDVSEFEEVYEGINATGLTGSNLNMTIETDSKLVDEMRLGIMESSISKQDYNKNKEFKSSLFVPIWAEDSIKTQISTIDYFTIANQTHIYIINSISQLTENSRDALTNPIPMKRNCQQFYGYNFEYNSCTMEVLNLSSSFLWDTQIKLNRTLYDETRLNITVRVNTTEPIIFRYFRDIIIWENFTSGPEIIERFSFQISEVGVTYNFNESEQKGFLKIEGWMDIFQYIFMDPDWIGGVKDIQLIKYLEFRDGQLYFPKDYFMM